jgi:hypothetical protein
MRNVTTRPHTIHRYSNLFHAVLASRHHRPGALGSGTPPPPQPSHSPLPAAPSAHCGMVRACQVTWTSMLIHTHGSCCSRPHAPPLNGLHASSPHSLKPWPAPQRDPRPRARLWRARTRRSRRCSDSRARPVCGTDVKPGERTIPSRVWRHRRPAALRRRRTGSGSTPALLTHSRPAGPPP